MKALGSDTTIAINRVADALFACAHEQKRQTRLNERAVVVSEQMLEMQAANLAVTKLLEAKLSLDSEIALATANLSH